MRETRRLVVAISLSGSAVSFSLTGTQKEEKRGGKFWIQITAKTRQQSQKQQCGLFFLFRSFVHSLFRYELVNCTDQHAVKCGITQRSGVIWVPDALHLQPLQEERGRQLPHQVNRQGVGLKDERKRVSGNQTKAPQLAFHEFHRNVDIFHSHFSNFGRPCDRNVVGYGRGEADERGDVEGSAWPLLLQAILCWRYVTLQETDVGSTQSKSGVDAKGEGIQGRTGRGKSFPLTLIQRPFG